MEFKVRTSPKTVWMFYAFFGLFFLISSTGIFLTDGDRRVTALAGTIFTGLMLIVMLVETTAYGSFYRISREGIYLKRLYFQLLIPLSEIKAVKVISENMTEDIFLKIQLDEVKNISSKNIISSFRSRLNMGRIIRYCIVPVVISKSGSGFKASHHSVNTTGDFVIILLKNTPPLLISPLDVKGFVSTYQMEAEKMEP